MMELKDSRLKPIVLIIFSISMSVTFLLLMGATSCFNRTSGLKPSPTEFHYPTAATVSPGGKYLIVANSNFDLEWDNGTVLMIDLDKVETMVRGCPGEGCGSFENNEEFVLSQETVIIGSYASFMSLSPGGKRIYLTVRGDNSLTTINLDEDAPSGSKLKCFSEGATSRQCDSPHRVQKGERIHLPPDPYAINSQLDGWVFVSHLTSNKISVFMVDPEKDIERDIPPQLLFINESFPESVSSIVKHPLSPLFYATSRNSSSIVTFTFVWDSVDFENEPRFYFGPSVSMKYLINGNDARQIAFTDDGSIAFISQRSPNSLLIVDTQLQPSGWPSNKVVGVIPIDQGPSLVTVWQPYLKDGEPEPVFVYVTCYNSDRLFVIDPFLRKKLDTIATGNGPHTFVVDSVRKFGYLVNFIESTISVIDINPESVYFNKIRATLGKPKPVKRND